MAVVFHKFRWCRIGVTRSRRPVLTPVGSTWGIRPKQPPRQESPLEGQEYQFSSLSNSIPQRTFTFYGSPASQTYDKYGKYDKYGTSAWPVLFLNDNYIEEYVFLGIQYEVLDCFLRSHAHEINEWSWIYLNKNSKSVRFTVLAIVSL